GDHGDLHILGYTVSLHDALAFWGVELDSWALSLPERYAGPLRTGEQPVLGRVVRGRLLLDLRCVPVEADEAVRAAVLRVPGDD
ncbi:hypothetical protein AB0J89_28050, partial [Micromonospora chokoriensis]